MCDLLRESRSSYYRHWQASAPGEEETALRDTLQRLALAHRHYGYRRLGVLLRLEGFMVNHKRVLRLMREDNLLCLRRRPFVPMTTTSDHAWPVMPNLVRGLQPTASDQIWVADITYVRLRQGFVYLAVVLDAFSRKVVGWAMADSLEAVLAVEALQRALADRRPLPGLIHHSDRGSQYASHHYRDLLERHGVQASMSRPGNPYDNAKAESFMATLKGEQIDGRAYRDLAHAKADIGGFIEEVYNKQRLHSALAYRSPEQFEADHRNQTDPSGGGAARSQCSAPPPLGNPFEPIKEAVTMQLVLP
jgi:transposase InsO family protein